MTLVKGPNGLVVDVAPTVASGLIGGGHVEAVDDSGTEVTESPTAHEETDTDGDAARPAGNASRGDWEEYALSQGYAEEQLEGLKQSEIRALFD